MQKLSDFVIDFIYRQGVEDIFMLPGGGCMHLVDSLGRHSKIKYIVNLHEQACAVAAEAYSQFTNNLGVALVTTGPGGTNAVTGVASAWLDSIPCLFISGQVKRDDMIRNRKIRQMGFQEINIVDIVKPITKYSVTIIEPESIRYHLEKAMHLAKSDRPGPVWIDIPLDVQSSIIDESALNGFDKNENKTKNRSIDKEIDKIVELLNESERPVILAGNGVRLAKAIPSLLKMVEHLKIPLLTTWKAIDFVPEDYEFYAGRPGSIGQRGANFVQQNSDLILILGARMDLGQTAYNHKNFARGARKIMVDIDQNEINKMMMPIDIPVCSDAKIFLEKLNQRLPQVKLKNRETWLKKCLDWKNRYPVILPEYYDKNDYVNDYVLIDQLSLNMSENDLLIPGSSGACSERTMQAFKVRSGIRVFNSEGLGPMGFGLPAAIGGCIASKRKRTVCIDGDGGFAMNIQELETVKRLNLPIKFFILNNKGYGSIRSSQNNFFKGRYVGSSIDSGLSLPDYCRVAMAYDIDTLRITNNNELINSIKNILECPGPFLCEVMVDPDQVTLPRIMNVQNPDGTIVSKPMEDLYPFLGRDEFRGNMIIPVLE